MQQKKNSSWKFILIAIFFGVFVVVMVFKYLGRILDLVATWNGEWEDEEPDLDESPAVQTKLIHTPRIVTRPAVVLKPKQKVQAVRNLASDFELSARQEDIYQLIRKEGELDMKSVADKVPGVSDRTLRRDMTKLEKLGLIKQVGKTRNSVYKLKE